MQDIVQKENVFSWFSMPCFQNAFFKLASVKPSLNPFLEEEDRNQGAVQETGHWHRRFSVPSSV